MAAAQEGGRGSLLTRLQASGLIRVNDKIVYRGSEGQEYEGIIVLGDDQAVYIKYNNESLKNEAVFVRKATGDVTIPKLFKSALTIGGRPFRDIQDDYKKANPRQERPAASASAGEGAPSGRARGNRRTRSNRQVNVRLSQLVNSGKLTVGAEAWFESKAGRISGTLAQKETRYGFSWNDEFYPSPAAFVRAAESSRAVPEADRIPNKFDSAVHVGELTVREAREKFLAERPPREPKPAAATSSSSNEIERVAAAKRLAQIREQIASLRAEEAELKAKAGEPASARRGRGRRPNRGRRTNKAAESSDATVPAQ